MKRVILTLLLLCVVLPGAGAARQSRWKDMPQWGNYFQTAKVPGCFLLYNLQRDEYFSYNRTRVNVGYLPASTFKIFNSLVALETGAVRDESEILKWDGVKRVVPAWNQDHNMSSAFKHSAVWFYQEMARRIGPKKMQRYVNAANYGNRNIGGGLDHFWLDGRLRITAKEQIAVLVKLYQHQLPFSPRTMRVVKDLMIHEKTDQYILRAKSGWAGLGDKSVPQTGWWVGYVERAGQAYFFAMNIDMTKDEDAPARMIITKSILREMKIIEP